MNPKVQLRNDSERGCGWRKPGGLYLISGGLSAACGILPIPLETCPTCSCGIKQTRGWTWIDPKALMAGKACRLAASACDVCPMKTISGKHGLLWIGGKFYEKPQDWTEEAIRQGVSRRIKAIPNGFELGKTWVFVAHKEVSRKACQDCRGMGRQVVAGTNTVLDGAPACEACDGQGSVPMPAIFHAFIPSAIEYVVKGDESEEALDRMIERGITPVHVERADGQPLLADLEEDETEVSVGK